ncbi:TatD DNase family protein [Dyella jiangningensis]|uniref:TatD family hydrolase n=1 Tax=Dyella sp. AtDHG13 TaxID=1938897 RepID=UPI00088E783B|nr:TatD family hydrolase [Dyella sp. AtDHG13]PXV60838.1 TatD DNase family protein [Dyella sp. AtDHG13]SDK96274.1 TatD DNase family protein [Dyella jiangningensis]
MLELTDSHAHIDDASFASDREAMFQRARDAGVRHIVVPAIDQASWQGIADLCAGHGEAHAAYGMHPIYIDRHRPEHLDQLRSWLQTHRAVAVGEIGLDYFLEGLDVERQREYFQQQLRIARDIDLPVIVHARKAMDEVTSTMRRIGGLRGVVHSFSGSLQQAEQLWNMGFHLGIGGPVTYERAQRLRHIVATMPVERLLLETDAPDQPGACHRGERNEPANIIEVLDVISQLRGESPEAIAQATTRNARALFRLA